MSPFLASILGLSSLTAVLLFYRAGSDVAGTLSPQGCRMSWMSPSYVLQNKFDTAWSPLAKRYSLWLYREVGWDSDQVSHTKTLQSIHVDVQITKIHGLPVLFIPGNAGSSRQVRSIASSATRQFYSSPHVLADEFTSGRLKSLDFFAGTKRSFIILAMRAVPRERRDLRAIHKCWCGPHVRAPSGDLCSFVDFHATIVPSIPNRVDLQIAVF